MSAPRSEARLLRALLLAAALLAPFTVTGLAQPAQTQPAEPQTPAPQETGPGILALLPPDSVTQHEITLDGARLNYTATAGTLTLRHRRSDESRVGQDGVSKCRSRWSPDHCKKHKINRP